MAIKAAQHSAICYRSIWRSIKIPEDL